jgi:UPF0271 protein
VLLNLDAGEHDDEPEALWALFDVLHVACGGHAGGDASMNRVAAFIAAHPRMRLGAHPSYPDRENFGRVSIAIDPAVLSLQLVEQLARLAAIARAHDLPVVSVKPHGALYHDANRNPALARLLVDAVRATLGPDITIVGPPSGELHTAATDAGMHYLREGFADRARRPDGSLVPRTEPNALILDPTAAAAQALSLAAAGGIDTLCIHADTPSSLAIARAVREAIHA